mgnify:CR=1 FL=1
MARVVIHVIGLYTFALGGLRMRTYSDDVAVLRTMSDSPKAQPEALIPKLDQDEAYTWLVDLLGDAMNDKDNPLAKVFNRMVLDYPFDVYGVENEILQTDILTLHQIGKAFVYLVGMAMLHQIIDMNSRLAEAAGGHS